MTLASVRIRYWGLRDLEELAAPSELKDLLKLSKEWHLQRDHYNVFGVNLFDKDSVWIDKEQIIGDVELVEQWREEHESPNCALSNKFPCSVY